jgi:hypothetical protein
MPAPLDRPSKAQLLVLAGLSAAMLSFEVLLLRLFALSHWHHFAGIAISLALLGLGAAGTTLALLGKRAAHWGDGWLLGCLLATAAGLLLVLEVHVRIALRPAFAAWDLREFGRLLLVDLVAFLPFYAGGLAVGQAFIRWPGQPRLLYGANLLGSGAGAVAASLLLMVSLEERALALIAALPLGLGLVLAGPHQRRLTVIGGLPLLMLALTAALWPPRAAVSDFKALANLQLLPGARVLQVLPGLPGRITLIRSDSLRLAPGLSLAWPEAVPSVDALVIGSDRVVAVPRSFARAMSHVDASLVGLPLQLRPQGEVLILGSGSWQTPPATPAHRLTWVEPDPRVLAIVRQRGAEGERWHRVAEAEYRFLQTTTSRYDLICVDRAYDGGDAASEDFLLTTEGLAVALGRLGPRGLLAVPLPLSNPPRHFQRILATLAAALKVRGVAGAGEHIAVLRGLRSLLILASAQALSSSDRARIRDFGEHWGFDLVWLPDVADHELNRHHRLETPVFHQVALAVLEGGESPQSVRWFQSGAADLASPYAWRSMQWQRVPELLRSLGPRAFSYLDWTLLLAAFATLLVAVSGALFILAPLGRLPAAHPPFDRLSVAAYFGALGFAYMLMEMAVFQRAILFLGEPVLTASLVFAVFLLGSGLGSGSAPRAMRARSLVAIWAPLGLGFTLGVSGLWAFEEVLIRPGLLARMSILAVLLLPLAWAMGRAFPWGLQQLGSTPAWLPWAWAINGFTSVTAAALAPLLSVQFGQRVTLTAGIVCYAGALGIALLWLGKSGAMPTPPTSGLRFGTPAPRAGRSPDPGVSPR